MRRKINSFISVIFSFVKFCLLKIFHWGNLHFSLIERFSPNVVVEIEKNGKLSLGKKVRVHSGSKIKVRSNAKLVLEDNVHLNYNCIIVCRKSVYIGAGTEFGPSVYIYDHDHDYKQGLRKQIFKEDEIKIGKNCWIGANTIILRGTTIGDNCVIGAGSVIKGNIPNNSVIIQQRETNIIQYSIVENIK